MGEKLITHHEMYIPGVSIVCGGMNVFPWIYKYTGASVYVQMKATENYWSYEKQWFKTFSQRKHLLGSIA